MQGRWEASGHGLLTVSGCYVQYDKYDTAGKGRRLILSYTPDGYVALGEWRTRVNMGAAGMPPKELLWRCPDAGGSEDEIAWWRPPPALQQRGRNARRSSTVHLRGSVDVGKPPDRQKLSPPVQEPTPPRPAKTMTRPRARVKTTPPHQDVAHTPSSVRTENLLPLPHGAPAPTPSDMTAAVVSSEHEAEEAEAEDAEGLGGLQWLVRKEKTSTPSCAMCCAPLRHATETESCSMACDVCRRSGGPGGAELLGDRLLVCTDRDDDNQVLDICAYAVCLPCSRKPHSERQSCSKSALAESRRSRKRCLDGRVVFSVHRSVW